MTDKLNIYQRLDKVRQKVAYIQKDAKVQGYKAVTHDMVTSEVRPALIEFGIMTIPRQKSGQVKDTGTVTSNGTPMIRYEAWYEVDFVNIDEPSDKVTVPIEAHAIDQGDKAPGKCISYATKSAMLKVFSIETGDSDESRQEMKPKPVTDEQIISLRGVCEKHSLPVDETLKAMAKKVFGVKDIKEVPAERYEEAVALLEKKANAQPAAH